MFRGFNGDEVTQWCHLLALNSPMWIESTALTGNIPTVVWNCVAGKTVRELTGNVPYIHRNLEGDDMFQFQSVTRGVGILGRRNIRLSLVAFA